MVFVQIPFVSNPLDGFIVKTQYELLIGLSYTRAGRRGRRKDRFLSFISGMSVASIALGVAALIIVLSVVNGFQKEVRDRMLSVMSHIEIMDTSHSIANWKDLALEVKKNPEVVAAAPFVDGQGLLSSQGNLRGVLVKGIDPAMEPEVSDLVNHIRDGKLADLTPGSFSVVIGQDLARQLGLRLGDKVALLVPQGSVTPAGVIPRIKQFTLVGYLNSGHYQYDSSMVLMNIVDASKVFKTHGPQGLRLKVKDMQDAPKIALQLQGELPYEYWVTDWSVNNATWFAAVQVEKRMMGIILFLIVLVGAFGLVSSLVMTVKEKQSDIAILRTIGASRGAIMRIFMIQGCVIGFVGVVVGVSVGLLIAYNVGEIVLGIEVLFGVQFLPKQIYFISNMPSDPRLSDILPISIFSFLLSLVATVYPSWRAANTQPAEALRYE